MIKYDPRKLKIFFNGVMLTNLGDGLINIEPNEDAMIERVGAQGEVAVTINADKTETATVSFMSTSPSIYYLRECVEKGIVGSFQLVDMNNNTVESCPQAWVKTKPAINKGSEIDDIDVEFFLGYEE